MQSLRTLYSPPETTAHWPAGEEEAAQSTRTSEPTDFIMFLFKAM